MTLLLILVPFITALLLATTPGVRTQRLLALSSSITTFLIILLVPHAPGVNLRWIPGLEAYFALSPAGASGVLVMVSALVMIPTVFYASLKVTDRTGAFLGLLLGMQASLNGVFLAKDLILFYLFWEVTLIPSLLMLGTWGGTLRRQAALKYLMYAVAGSFLMLVSILSLRPLSGAASYRFDDLMATVPLLDIQTQIWIFVGFALAFAVKLPLWPLHNWLPDFHEQNHPSGAADVAGTLYKVGGWGFFAWALPLLPGAAEVAAPILLAVAAFTALYAAVIAISQTHMKRMLAYASLSHMGIVGVGIFGLHIAGLNGAVYLLAAQMVSTGAVFLISGMLYERRKTFDLRQYGGLAKSAPALAAVSLFAIFASIGVPGLSNFPGEFMSLMGAYQASPWAAFVATTAVIAAGVFGVNLYQRLYQGREEHGPAPEMSRIELLTLVPLILAILWLGIFPQTHIARIEQQARLIPEGLELHLTRNTPLPEAHLARSGGEQ